MAKALFCSAIVLAAAVRFATLGSQSFWYDEAVAASLVHRSFGGMLATLPHSESSPPLYYVVAWVWSRIFGTSEVGLRSLSAVCGVATIPVAFATACVLVRRRGAALAVAAFAAVSPIMVWYSQESRAYVLYVLLAGLSMLFFARSLDEPSRRNLWAWSAFSVLAVATHYFAAFLVAGEAVLLLARLGWRRLAWPLCPLLAVGAALAPLALYQNRHVAAATSISAVPLASRFKEVAVRFLFLYYNPAGDATLAVGLAAVALLIFRGRRAGRAALALAAFAILLPLLFGLVSIDAFHFRNLLDAWLPLAVVVAAGLPRTARLGLPLVLAVSLVFLACTLKIAASPGLQRDAWRQALQVVRGEPGMRLIVGDSQDMAYTFRYYWRLPPLAPAGVRVHEIDFVGRYLTPTSTIATLPQFKVVGAQTAANMTIVRLRAARSSLVTPRELAAQGLAGEATPG